MPITPANPYQYQVQLSDLSETTQKEGLKAAPSRFDKIESVETTSDGYTIRGTGASYSSRAPELESPSRPLNTNDVSDASDDFNNNSNSGNVWVLIAAAMTMCLQEDQTDYVSATQNELLQSTAEEDITESAASEYDSMAEEALAYGIASAVVSGVGAISSGVGGLYESCQVNAGWNEYQAAMSTDDLNSAELGSEAEQPQQPSAADQETAKMRFNQILAMANARSTTFQAVNTGTSAASGGITGFGTSEQDKSQATEKDREAAATKVGTNVTTMQNLGSSVQSLYQSVQSDFSSLSSAMQTADSAAAQAEKA